MKTKKTLIHGLDQFGLTVGQLAALGSLKIKLDVHFRHIDEKCLFKLTPSQRAVKMRSHYEALLSRMKKKWSYGPITISWIRRQPRGLSAFVEARHVPDVLRMPENFFVWIGKIPGQKHVALQPKEHWFAVKARFGIQVEDQARGLQSYEDRIVRVKALSPDGAKGKLQSEFKKYGSPYLNPHYRLVRWAFEAILDVYEVGEQKIDPQGTEVFSTLAQRRMKPEHAWIRTRQARVDTK